ncbi:hypothetical protein GCM10022223_46110 [Kineosporia mesophila]|uniref:SprT-like domain-containing protein n=1 Tax=Kineosporia mesophila TaxID=566012 RepID=A0ABP7A2W5_9ACTN|nr:SprT-like domain-containing protein [Kineosporia mesophila]
MELIQARALAVGLMRRHGLSDWRLVFDNAKTRAGICRAEPREIGLSRVLAQLHSRAEVTETVLHEIAHALVGPAHGHDEIWQAQARAIGCSGTRCLPQDAPRPPGPWRGTCPRGHSITRHRQPVRVQSCGECSRAFDPSSLLDWMRNGEVVPMHPSYVAERRWVVQRVRPGRPEPAVAARGAVPEPAVTGRDAALFPIGTRVRLICPGKYAGTTGKVVRIGRTRYHVQVRRQLLTVPFSQVERY